MKKKTKIKKPKVIGYKINLVVDGKAFSFEVPTKTHLKELLSKNKLKGINIVFSEILEPAK
jgi:hypothetical protein